MRSYREYCRRENLGGVIFWQVPVGSHYPKSEARWIDAVRIPSEDEAVIKYFTPKSREEFQRLIPHARAEVIEIKRKMNRLVIGQAIVGKHLLQMEHRSAKVTPIILCRERDGLLEKVCEEKLHVRVWTPRNGFVC